MSSAAVNTEVEERYVKFLLGLPDAPKALTLFDRLYTGAINQPQEVFFANLYQSLVDHLLMWLEWPNPLPEGASRDLDQALNPTAPQGPYSSVEKRYRHFAWNSLYRLPQDVSPEVIAERDVTRAVEDGPECPPRKRRIIITVVTEYFALCQAGFLEDFPSPVISGADTQRWIDLFPEEWAWQATELLRGLGLLTLGSKASLRTYLRVTQGVPMPDYDYRQLVDWIQKLEAWGGQGWVLKGQTITPHLFNFLGAVYTGRLRSLGLEGICGENPECGRCTLEPHCRYAQVHQAPFISGDQELHPFAAYLASHPEAPAALRLFDQLYGQPHTLSAQTFYARLYEHLVDYLLNYIDWPPGYRARGAHALNFRPGFPGDEAARNFSNLVRRTGWRALYALDRELDPYYFSRRHIRDAVLQGPDVGEEKRDFLIHVLTGYFKLRREGFPSDYPNPLLSRHDSERWLRIFPAELGWHVQLVLRGQQLLPLGSRAALRGYQRYSQGEFDPPFNTVDLINWQDQLEEWEAAGVEVEGRRLTGHQIDFLGVMFCGRFNPLGFNGACSYVPDCERCDLRHSCRWYKNPRPESDGAMEVLALANKGPVEHLEESVLFQALFNLADDEARSLNRRMEGRTLRELADLSQRELEVLVEGTRLGKEQMRLLFELCMRFNEERMQVGMDFQTPWDVFKHFRMRLRDLKQEQFIVVLLDKKRKYLGDQVISQGTLDSSPVHPRDVFKAAIRESAACVLIVHNHPSGDPTPSSPDIAVTRHLKEAGEMVGIPVLDHVIIADDRYISMATEGLLS